MTRQTILSATGLVLIGLVLSILGLAMHTLTPPEGRTWAPVLPAIATCGLTVCGAWVIARKPSAERAGRAWHLTALITAAAIVAAAIALAGAGMLPVALMAVVALQGPLAAEVVSRRLIAGAQ